MCNLINNRMISVPFKSKPLNVTVIQVYPPTGKAKEAEFEWFYEDWKDLLEPTPKLDVLSSSEIPWWLRWLKCLPPMQETRVLSLGWEDLLEKEMATHPSTFPGKFHGWRSLVGYSPWGGKESDTTKQLHFSS